MGAYANDPGVTKVSDREYRVREVAPRYWAIREECGVWNTYDPDGEPSRFFRGGRATADDALAAIVGEPR